MEDAEWGKRAEGKGRMSLNIFSPPDPVLRGPCSKEHKLKKFLASLKQLPAPPYEHQQNNTITTFPGAQPEVPCFVCLRSPPAVQRRIKRQLFYSKAPCFPRDLL